MKNLFYIWAAFMMGVSLTIAIQACGEDPVPQKAEESGGSGGGETGNGTCECNVAWMSQKLAKETYKDNKGRTIQETVYKYDSKGRIAQMETTQYRASSADGPLKKSGFTRIVCMYSSDNTQRTDYQNQIGYNESGEATEYPQYTTVRTLYQK